MGDKITPTMRVREVAACPVCGAPGKVRYSQLNDRLFGVPGEWSLKECTSSSCDLHWLDPAPVPGDLHLAYASYYTHTAPETGPSARHAIAALVPKILRGLLWRLPGVKRIRGNHVPFLYLGGDTPGRLLEIGCGSGAYLNRMHRRGWSVKGLDFDQSAVDSARQAYGLDVQVGDVLQANYAAGSFDAVVMNHVLEHLPDPASVITECQRLLAPGGKLVVVTPNIRSYGAHLFGKNWRGLEPPRHLQIFGPKSLRSVGGLDGFQSVSVTTSPANAEVIMYGSLSIARDGMHDMRMEFSSIWRSLVSIYHECIELRGAARNPDSGEEAVLIAVKAK